MGTQVADQIQGSIAGAQEEIGTLGGKFQQKADEGQISDIANAPAQAQGIANKAASAPVGQGPSTEETNRFKEVSNAQYQGPNALIDTDFYQPAYTKMKQAQNYADLSKDESGNQQLLRDMYKTPSYSTGENRFDSYLLSSDDNKQKLAGSRVNAGNLQANFDAADTGASEYAKLQKQLADSVRNQSRSGLEGTRTQRSQEIDQDLAGIESGWNSEYDQYLNLLNNSDKGNNLQLNDEQMGKLGVSEDQRIFNLLDGSNADDYLSMQAFDPNKVIGKDQQYQLAALDMLAGQYGGTQTNKFTQQDLAGTLDKSAAFAADKFGLSAKEQQGLFDNNAKAASMISEATASGVINQSQARTITESIQESIEKTGGDWWNPFKYYEMLTRVVSRVVNVDVPVGKVDAKASSEGTVAQFLAGQGPAQKETGSKELNWGTIAGPSSLVSDQADNKIKELQDNLKNQTKSDWTQQILNYLEQAGYNKQVKKG